MQLQSCLPNNRCGIRVSAMAVMPDAIRSYNQDLNRFRFLCRLPPPLGGLLGYSGTWVSCWDAPTSTAAPAAAIQRRPFQAPAPSSPTAADNIQARNAEHALVMGHRLKAAVQRVTGLQPYLSAFANEYTVNCLRKTSSSESWEVRRHNSSRSIGCVSLADSNPSRKLHSGGAGVVASRFGSGPAGEGCCRSAHAT